MYRQWPVSDYQGSIDMYMSGPQTQPTRKGLGNNLARKCLAGMWRLLNSATHFLFQIFNVMGQALLQYSKFLCSTVYSLPIINWTWMLVGWSDVRSLINTDSSIPALKTLPGEVFPQTLPRRLGLGSRLYVILRVCWCLEVYSSALLVPS